MTDSSTGGYLQPENVPAPLDGRELTRFLQQWIAGVAGLDGTMVRPRWTPEPPSIPEAGEVWCAIGITHQTADTCGHVAWKANGAHLKRHEVLTLLCSFYDLGVEGLANKHATRLRDGVQVGQNLEALTLAGFGFVDASDLTVVPSLLKARWLYRLDVTVTVRREVERVYPIKSVAELTGTLAAEGFVKPILVIEE